jgi:hypothetical protein
VRPGNEGDVGRRLEVCGDVIAGAVGRQRRMRAWRRDLGLGGRHDKGCGDAPFRTDGAFWRNLAIVVFRFARAIARPTKKRRRLFANFAAVGLARLPNDVKSKPLEIWFQDEARVGRS